MNKFVLIIFLFAIVVFPKSFGELSTVKDTIIDCNYKLSATLKGNNAPKTILDQIILADVVYYSFDHKLHKGQILVNKKYLAELKAIFSEILQARFPIQKVIPISIHNWDDEASMQDNNSSCFNYRRVKNQKVLSRHSYGAAIDINPLFNPRVKDKSVEPKGAKYDITREGTITSKSSIVKIFKKYGWRWGGDWRHSKDYQHFEK